MKLAGAAARPAGTGRAEPVLVVGGGGFLGSRVVKRLLARGTAVRVFGRREYPELAVLGADCRRGDVLDPDAVRQAMEGCQAVVHAAAQPGIGLARYSQYAVNVQGTKNALDAAVALAVQKFIYVGSPSAVCAGGDIEGGDENLPYPKKHLCAYAAAKALAERAVLARNSPNFATVSLRPHLMFGPGDTQLFPKLFARARSGGLRRVGAGKNLVSVCYVDNAADAHVLALDRLEPNSAIAGKAYFINEPDPVNCWDFINRALTATGLARVEKSLPFPIAYAIGRLFEAAYAFLGRHDDPPMTRFLACQLARSHWFRVDRARRDLGWAPAVPLEEAFRRTFS
ncbi:MAG: NAD-dependent epimerase/dehydratase family protein [Planctomycetota bacterium]|nr:NAD-dependent epimerase/dehydratase family protein [Planctomycetota bacterium]